jgi:hypothetical protein
MLQGSGEGPIDWNDNAKDLPVCKEIDRRGIVDDTKPMSGYVFRQILRKLLMAEYSLVWPITEGPSRCRNADRRHIGR